MLTPFLGELGSASTAKAVVAAAGSPGRVLVFADVVISRALASKGFVVVMATASKRVRARAEFQLVRALAAAVPVGPKTFDAVVYAGRGGSLRGAAEDASSAVKELEAWITPLSRGGRLVLIDRIDGGILGTRQVAQPEDLCAALLAARLSQIAQAVPRAGTIVTRAIREG